MDRRAFSYNPNTAKTSFNNPTLMAGDIIRVRDSALPAGIGLLNKGHSFRRYLLNQDGLIKRVPWRACHFCSNHFQLRLRLLQKQQGLSGE